MSREFDELARALASGMSRRTALKRFAAAAVGVAFAGLIPGRAAAKSTFCGTTPKTCEEFCAWAYGKGTKQYYECVYEGACQYGPCYQFGPQSVDCRHSLCPAYTVCVSLNMNSNSTVAAGSRRYYCQPI